MAGESVLDDIIQNPFPGLRAFEEDEDILFFGREKQIDELLKKLRLVRFLTVIGSSGSGKSSLVKSGLIPSLHSGFMSGAGSRWKICTFRPGNNPIGNLAHALSKNGVLYTYESEEDEHTYSAINESTLRRSNFGLIDAYKQSGVDPKNNLLILVDQFEELFRFSRYEKDVKEGKRDSAAFINLLLKATEQRELPIYVVFTMRSDFLGDCTEFRGLPEAINEGQYLVPRMTREERRDAITGPVSVGGAAMSPRLLNQLLNDVGDNPDQLPILQHAMMRTWDLWKKKYENSAEPGEIDLAEYNAIGTMQLALSQHAEEAYAELDTPRERQICELVFKALTDKGADARGIRRPRQLAELCEVANASEAEVIAVVDTFRRKGRGFLMPPHNVALNESSIIDISHESIMRVWDRLMLWVDEENQSAQIYLRLCDASNLYETGKGGLLRDPELQVSWKWKEENSPNATWASRYNNQFDKAILFLDHSKDQFEKELSFKEKMQKQRLRRARRIATVISVIGFGAFLLAIYAFELRNLAKKQTKIAEQESVEAKRQRRIAMEQEKNARRSKEIALSNEQQALIQKGIAEKEKLNAQNSEKNAILQKGIAEEQKGYAENQKVIAEQNAGIARQQQARAETQTELAIRNEKTAVTERTNAARLKDLATARNMASRAMLLLNDKMFDESRKAAVDAYQLNAANNGPLLNNDVYGALYANWTNTIGNKNQSGVHKYAVRSITRGPGNQLLSVDESGMVYLSRTANGILEPVATLNVNDEARYVASSPDGSKAVIVTASGNLILLDLTQNKVKISDRSLFGGIGKQVKFKNNTEFTVLSTKGLGFFRAGTTIEAVNTVGAGAISALAYGRNGRVYAAAGNKVNVYNSEADLPAKPASSFTLSSRVTSLAIGPNDQYLAAGTYDGGVWLKELGNTKAPVSFTPHASAVNDIEFNTVSGGILQLATASSDQTIRLLDVKDRVSGENDQDIITLKGHGKWVYCLQYSSDGRFIFSGSEDKKAIGWPSSTTGLYQSLTAGKN